MNQTFLQAVAIANHYAGWTRLQFSSKTEITVPDIHPNTWWIDGTFRAESKGWFMGESGCCLYVVQRCVGELPKCWRVAVYQFPSAQTNRKILMWTTKILFHPGSVAVDVEQDLLVFVRSESGSFGSIHFHRLSTGEKIEETFQWNAEDEIQAIVAQVEIKGSIIGIWIRNGVLQASMSGKRLGPPQLRFFDRKTRSMIYLPVDGSLLWGFQFIDNLRVIVSCVSNRQLKGKTTKGPRLLLLKLTTTPIFKLDRSNGASYFIDIPPLKGQIVDHVVFIRNISTTDVASSLSNSPFNNKPFQRLIGLKFLHAPLNVEKKREAIAVITLDDLLRRNQAGFLLLNPKKFYGDCFAIYGRRLIWFSGSSKKGYVHLHDFNGSVASMYLGPQKEKQVFASQEDPEWETTSTSLEYNTIKGATSVSTITNALSGIKKIFPTKEGLVVIKDQTLDAYGQPLEVCVYRV